MSCNRTSNLFWITPSRDLRRVQMRRWIANHQSVNLAIIYINTHVPLYKCQFPAEYLYCWKKLWCSPLIEMGRALGIDRLAQHLNIHILAYQGNMIKFFCMENFIRGAAILVWYCRLGMIHPSLCYAPGHLDNQVAKRQRASKETRFSVRFFPSDGSNERKWWNVTLRLFPRLYEREFHESNFRFVMCCTSIGTRKRQRHSWHRPSVTSRNRKRVANELN